LSLRSRRSNSHLQVFQAVVFCLAGLGIASLVSAHDIPNQRVDRSTQATVRPGSLEIDYEVSLTELTLTQDLRSLIGSLPGGDRAEWLARYAQVTGPLNAKGFLITVEGSPVVLTVRGHDLVVEEHPRYTFHFEGSLPAHGRMVIHDTNYASSEGTSRLAVRPRDGVQIQGDSLPADVAEIPIRPVWQLSDEEERRSRKVEISFRGPGVSVGSSTSQPVGPSPARPGAGTNQEGRFGTLSRLLDRRAGPSWLGLILIAAGLGAVHAIQPGHGKTMVSAIALAPGSRWYQPALLGVAATVAHTGSVLLIAAILWCTGASQVASLHRGLSQAAGFAIAAGGLWRVGWSLRQRGDQQDQAAAAVCAPSAGGLISLGLAGGLVPCWDAVGLVVLSAAVGRLETGVTLVIAFGLGMATVLVAVGMIASRVKAAVLISSRARMWESQLGLASGLILAVIGLGFFLT
jgi:ABC-type nickel/cobalt efflux system permease component RcnA